MSEFYDFNCTCAYLVSLCQGYKDIGVLGVITFLP